MATRTRRRAWLRWVRRLRADTWIALAAQLTSLCALALTIYQAEATRKHDRLTVMPRLLVSYSYRADSGAALVVDNRGLGPVLVKTFDVLVDDSAVTSWEELMSRLRMRASAYRFSQLFPGEAFPAGTIGVLFGVDSGASARYLRRQIHRVDVQICYCSLYEDCWQTKFWAETLPAPHGVPANCPKDHKHLFRVNPDLMTR
jgi:hypothetical protein